MRYHISNGVKNDFSPFCLPIVEGTGGFFCLGKVAWACSRPLHTCRYNETTYRATTHEGGGRG